MKFFAKGEAAELTLCLFGLLLVHLRQKQRMTSKLHDFSAYKERSMESIKEQSKEVEREKGEAEQLKEEAEVAKQAATDAQNKLKAALQEIEHAKQEQLNAKASGALCLALSLPLRR
ncbi:hypothetical protein CYMTET_35576, partial [Cymbomonas tetramitiformis]